MTEKEKLIQAKNLFDTDCFEESKSILLNINLRGKSSKFIEVRNQFLASCHFELENYIDAIYWAEKANEINNSNEFASQIKYLSYAKSKEFDKAINELLQFLKHYPAELYIVTLKELMIDIYKGNIQEEFYINEIKKLALQHKIFH